MKKTSLLLLALALALQLTACGSSSNGRVERFSASSAAAKEYEVEEAAPQAVAMDSTAQTATGGMGEEAQGALPPALELPEDINRKIIWSVHMELESLEFERALDSITQCIANAGGFIESSAVNQASLNARWEGEGRNAHLVARVPHEKLDDFLDAVSGACYVVNSTRTSEDITLEYSDIEARKKALEVEQERLMALLEKAGDIETIVALEQRLSDIRYQLDSYTSSLMKYDSLINFSTVSMNLREVARVSDPVPQNMGERISTGFSRTLYNLGTGAKDLLVWLVVNSPYLLLWAALAALIMWGIRALRRRRARRGSARGRVKAPALGGNPYKDAPAPGGQEAPKPQEDQPPQGPPQEK